MNFAEKIAELPVEEIQTLEDIEKDEKHPYIHVVKHHESENRYYAFFGVKIDSIVNKSHLNESNFSYLLFEQLKFIQNLLVGHPEQSIELRYISKPDKENWMQGKIDIVLFSRNISNSHDEAYLKAKELWKNISPVLNTEASYYELSPIEDTEGFNFERLPFEIKDIAEITRREEIVPLNRHEQFYLPCPFVLAPANLSRLCKGLLAQGLPLIYSVTLQPVRLTGSERIYLENPHACGKEPGFLSHIDKQASLLIGEEHSTKSTYLMKIQVASSETIPSSLLDLIGSEITAPPMNIEVNAGDTRERSYRGGYSWNKPRTDKDFGIALNNLKYHGFEIWAPSIALHGMNRLRYIFDLAQACSAFRLPIAIKDEDFPGIRVKNSIPVASSHLSGEGVLLGISRYGTAKNEIRLKSEERRKHCYIQGATGTGKTTVILNMALQDINEGRGVVVIDYIGDLCQELIKRMPRERVKERDVIYFNPSDIEYPVGFNPLAYDPKSPLKDLMKENIVDSILSWLKKEYEKDTMGPIYFQNVRNALLLVMSDDEPATLVDFVNIFFDSDLFQRKLKTLKNPLVRKFWEEVYDRKRYKTISDNGVTLLQWIISKFSPLVDMELTRNIFGQRESKLNFREIIDNRKILLCNLSKGLIGGFNASFFGLMILSKIEQAALSRADIPEEKRVDSYLYLDECQNLQTEHFYNMLSEMRKYRINITLANQHFSQLDEKMRDSILSNCGTVIIFKTGVKDAEILEPVLYPYDKKLVLKLPNYHAMVRAVSNGDMKILTMETLPLDIEENPNIADAVIKLSKLHYGKSKEDVEKEIFKN